MNKKQSQLQGLQKELSFYQKYEQEEIHYGRMIQRYREIAGYSRETLAEALNIATRTLENIESERNRPSLDLLHELSLVLNFSITIQNGQVLFGHSNHQGELIYQQFEKKVTAELKRVLKKQTNLLDLLIQLDGFIFERFHEHLGCPLFHCPTSFQSNQISTTNTSESYPCSVWFEVFLEWYQFELHLDFQLEDSETWENWMQQCSNDFLTKKQSSKGFSEDSLLWYTICLQNINDLSTVFIKGVHSDIQNEKQLPTYQMCDF